MAAEKPGGGSYSANTNIDGLPTTQKAWYDSAPRSIVNGEPVGYTLHGFARLDDLPPTAEDELPVRPGGHTTARVTFETAARVPELLEVAADAAALALRSLRAYARRQ